MTTKAQEFLAALPVNTQEQFVPMFGNINRFYTVVYLIARNEHVTGQEKPDRYEERLEIIRRIRVKMEHLVDSFGLDGTDIVADIASDYFEDYVNFREQSLDISNEEFINVINRIAVL